MFKIKYTAAQSFKVITRKNNMMRKVIFIYGKKNNTENTNDTVFFISRN